MQIHQSRVITSLLLLLYSLPSSAWICYPPPGVLPRLDDCLGLIAGVAAISHRPENVRPKRWGRHLHTSAALNTEQLPKWFVLHNTGELRPPTCALLVDNEAEAPTTVDMFPMIDVATAGATVIGHCLGRRQQVGLEFPHEGGRTTVKVVRFDEGHMVYNNSNAQGRDGSEGQEGGLVNKQGDVRSVALPSGNGTIWILGDPPWVGDIEES